MLKQENGKSKEKRVINNLMSLHPDKIRNFEYLDHYNEFSIGDIVYYDYFSYNGKSRVTRFAIILKICREEVLMPNISEFEEDQWRIYHQAYVRWLDESLIDISTTRDPKKMFFDMKFWKKINIQLLKKVNVDE